jgi:type II secretory pathway pseudopilin PulG
MAIKEITKQEKGILIVELLVVIAIISIALVTLLGTTAFSLKISILAKQNDQAKKLAEGALEAVRSFRDGTNWDTDGLGTIIIDPYPQLYHPEQIENLPNPPKWNLVSGEETVGVFKRKVVFKRVLRDANDNISSSGVVDLNTKEVTATVSWGIRQVEISTYLTNWR